MSFYLDIAKKVTVGNTQGSSSADREHDCGAIVEADDDQLQLSAPANTLTPSHSLLLGDLGASESRVSPNAAPGTQAHYTTRSNKVDAEFARFERVARPMPGGGLYCPVYGSPQMPVGTPGADWDALVADCGRLGKRGKS